MAGCQCQIENACIIYAEHSRVTITKLGDKDHLHIVIVHGEFVSSIANRSVVVSGDENDPKVERHK
eukprot:scaffold21088_cov70-Cyclotella_meneghiniana.AAC.2